MIEWTAEVKAQCLNLKSQWAGSKIPGLTVSNSKGLICAGRGTEGQEEIEAYKEAVKRGCKRIQYRTAPDTEVDESKEMEERNSQGGK